MKYIEVKVKHIVVIVNTVYVTHNEQQTIVRTQYSLKENFTVYQK